MGFSSEAHMDCWWRRFLHDIAYGLTVVTGGLRKTTDVLDEDMLKQASQRRAAATAEAPVPLQLLLHVSNLSVVLPASSKCASCSSPSQGCS